MISTPKSEIIIISTNYDSSIGKDIILWDDILLASPDAIHVRNGDFLVPFVKDDRFRNLDPLRILANQEAIFDIIEKDSTESLIKQHVNSTMVADIISTVLGIALQAKMNADKYEQDEYINYESQQSISTSSKDSKPIYQIGLGYEAEDDVMQEYSLAMENYLISVEEELEVHCEIGMLNGKGHGVPQDYSNEMELYLKAAEQGDPDAQFSVG
ncbi:hypothetical protein BGZ76_011020, partial [Entomortierella beljakovae]